MSIFASRIYLEVKIERERQSLAATSGSTRSNAAANTTRVDDRNTVPTQPKNQRLNSPTTMNIKAEDPAASDEHVWVPANADVKAPWLTGGSYLVVRRINMTIEIWDRQPLSEQERVIGRTKAEGAPLSGGS